MIRKVIMFGSGTHVLSLPASWVRKYGVKKGDEIRVEEKSGMLLLDAGKSLKRDVARLDCNLDVCKRLMQLYCSGYDEVELKVDSISEVHDALERLPGFEIVDVKGRYCIVRDISSPRLEEFPNMLRRFFMVLCAIEGGDRKLRAQVPKISSFCKRCLSKKEYGSHSYSMMLFLLVNELERLCGELKDGNGFVEELSSLFYKYEPSRMEEFKKRLVSERGRLVKACLNITDIIETMNMAE